MVNKLIHGDCLEELKKIPDETIDAIITDPPYCSGGFTETGKRYGSKTRSNNVKWFDNDNMTTMGLVWLLREVLIEFKRILKPGGSALVFCDWRMYPMLAPALESSGTRHQNLIVWNKNYAGLGFGFRSKHELIMQFAKGKPSYYRKNGKNVIDAKKPPTNRRHHPTEKPLDLMTELISVVTPPGGIILDPFAGSGSTLVAAKQGGYNYIGIEKESEYIEIARKRLEEVGREEHVGT